MSVSEIIYLIIGSLFSVSPIEGKSSKGRELVALISNINPVPRIVPSM